MTDEVKKKKKTISARWKEWNKKEPRWSYSALACFVLSVGVGLPIHLGIQNSLWSLIGLIMLIGFDAALLFITAFRKRWWWFTFFCYITAGVIGWEIASYFFG